VPTTTYKPAFGRDLDVAGLDVAVNHQILMSIVHGRADAAKQLKPPNPMPFQIRLPDPGDC
jgi:hypothetical protein